MRRMQRIVMLATMLAVAPVLSGCADFDADKLDIFGINEKKKLPGDRKPVFPQGVPGVSQGIPPEFMKGNQPPPDAAPTAPVETAAEPAKQAAAVEPAEPQKPKPKRKKPRPAVAAPAQPPAQDQQQPPQQSSTAPWPSSPPTGTFSR